jgi:hypothetical protein
MSTAWTPETELLVVKTLMIVTAEPGDDDPDEVWAEASDEEREDALSIARALLDALAEAGLLVSQ